MSVKREIEKHPVLFDWARSLNYRKDNATLADLKRELEAALAVTAALVESHGADSFFNDRGTRRPSELP